MLWNTCFRLVIGANDVPGIPLNWIDKKSGIYVYIRYETKGGCKASNNAFHCHSPCHRCMSCLYAIQAWPSAPRPASATQTALDAQEK